MINDSFSTRARRRSYTSSSDGFLHLLLFYILPFILFNGFLFFCVTTAPEISLELADTKDYLTTEATLTIESWFPTKSVSVNLDGEEPEMTEDKRHSYTIPISKNGVLEATVVNLNGMSVTQYVHVNILDENPPAIEGEHIEDGIVTLTVTDSQSGVDFDSIYALDGNGEQVIPIEVDRDTNTLSYEMDSSGLYVYAQDRAGNQVQGTFTSRMEGDLEMLESSTNVSVDSDEESVAEISATETDVTEDSTKSETTGSSSIQITIN
ncbi:MAG: hypothetical protein LUC99_10535 [Clostridiales bacterium]|nr:hypothetical protein [Clostridiales bacterium]MCD8225260.1 hypothetical protein [Clostridiales bacterium]